MDHQGDAHRLKTAARQLGPVRGGGSRQHGAGNVRKVDPGLFEYRAFGQYPAAAAAAFCARPVVFDKGAAAVGLRQLFADAVLQRQQEGFYFSDIG